MKRISIYLLVLIILFNPIVAKLIDLLSIYKKMNVLLLLNKNYLYKINIQYNIIKQQQLYIKLDSLQLNYNNYQIDLYKQLIMRYKLITQIDSIRISQLKNNTEKWYLNKYIYYILGMSTMLLSSIIVRNTK